MWVSIPWQWQWQWSLLHVTRRLNRYMHRQKQLKHRKVKWFNNNIYMYSWNKLTLVLALDTPWVEIRVTIEDGVYSLVIEVKIESMFDKGKGRMIRTTNIFLVRVGMLGNLVGAQRWASKSGSREGGSKGWRKEVGWTMEWKKITREFVS